MDRTNKFLQVCETMDCQAAEDQEEELPRCALCNEDLLEKNPVTLHCLHIYCLSCIKAKHEKAVQKEPKDKDTLYCPRCACPTTVPDGCVENIQPFFVSNSIKDLHTLAQHHHEKGESPRDSSTDKTVERVDSRSYTIEGPGAEDMEAVDEQLQQTAEALEGVQAIEENIQESLLDMEMFGSAAPQSCEDPLDIQQSVDLLEPIMNECHAPQSDGGLFELQHVDNPLEELCHEEPFDTQTAQNTIEELKVNINDFIESANLFDQIEETVAPKLDAVKPFESIKAESEEPSNLKILEEIRELTLQNIECCSAMQCESDMNMVQELSAAPEFVSVAPMNAAEAVQATEVIFRCMWCEIADPVRFCFQCATFLCASCLSEHNNIEESKTHFAAPITKESASKMLCAEHKRHYKNFCTLCYVAVCDTCHQSTHSDHECCEYCPPEEAEEILLRVKSEQDKNKNVINELSLLARKKKKVPTATLR